MLQLKFFLPFKAWKLNQKMNKLASFYTFNVVEANYLTVKVYFTKTILNLK
jgi:hypothetical protein